MGTQGTHGDTRGHGVNKGTQGDTGKIRDTRGHKDTGDTGDTWGHKETQGT